MKLLTVTFLLFTFVTTGQKDFNNYSTLQSKGPIPEDFTRETYSKIEEDLKEGREELNKSQEKIFLEGTNYAIDEILHSGMVIYGDEISLYITQIVDRLLRNDQVLRSKLRIYTIKSNSANAFSTDQGIIFVTTGLIAQMTSEAQLAYVLAHEISHYTERHVVETFDWKTKNYRQDDRIGKLSQYSREKEFEADRIGVKLYNEAGYSKDEIISTFDVLMYSYLPFDEVEFPETYFNTKEFYVPKTLFPSTKYPIKAEEDYDDSLSTHPNIKKRKEATEIEIGKYSNWGEATQFLGDDKFNEIRTIARFENVRSDILNGNFGDAIYSIFLLEHTNPNSLYLQRMKAQIWLNFLLYKEENIANRVIKKGSELEGESASLHFFLKKLNREGVFSLALRQVFDIRQLHPQDNEIGAIYNRLIKELTYSEKFKPENYSSKTFEIAAKDAINLKDSISNTSIPDTLKTAKNESKYDRIKKKKNVNNPLNFDSTQFYLYGLNDILKNSEFNDIRSKIAQDKEEEQKKKDEIAKLSKRERNEIKKKETEGRLNIGLNDVIVVEPIVYAYKSGKMDPVKSERLEKTFSEAIENSAQEVGVSSYTIDSRSLATKGTQGYNERSTLMTFLSQISEEEDVDAFPVDYQLLQEIKNNYGTSNVMFSLVEHERSVDINWWLVGCSAVLYPTFPFVVTMYIPSKIFKAHKTELNIIVLDMDKAKITTGESFYFYEPIRKLNLGAHMYEIFQQLNTTNK